MGSVMYRRDQPLAREDQKCPSRADHTDMSAHGRFARPSLLWNFTLCRVAGDLPFPKLYREIAFFASDCSCSQLQRA